MPNLLNVKEIGRKNVREKRRLITKLKNKKKKKKTNFAAISLL